MENLAEVFDSDSMAYEALEKFIYFLEDIDFAVEMELMGIGRLQFMRRRQMLIEWKAIYIALWRLALASSFPEDASRMFDAFLNTYKKLHSDKISVSVVERAREYWGMIQPHGDSDFNDIARHLCSFFGQEKQDMRSLNLKIVLHVRKAYRIIFDKLI